jgi:hypothetical protein
MRLGAKNMGLQEEIDKILSDKLDEEFVWRKKELAAIKALIDNKQYSERKKRTLIRSGITL